MLGYGSLPPAGFTPVAGVSRFAFVAVSAAPSKDFVQSISLSVSDSDFDSDFDSDYEFCSDFDLTSF
jgi:hypothetical protein